ncbi:VOC family protein [Nocardioides sp. SR21]|uniref:VOC family protein n=1 Tax=Nocardioides sp. SR21 TaxID=2919501 RepID=UPI001FAA8A55|nr:VOC family protein [Nocardioides sp. SR21]
MIATWRDLSIDATDNVRLGRFWADTLGLDLEKREDGLVMLTGPTPQSTIWLDEVPEPLTAKQRVHLDVHAGSVEEVLARGATPLEVDRFDWKVLRDPEGGELCVFVRDEVPEQRLYEIVVDAHDTRAQAAWWADVLGGRIEEGSDGEAVEAIPGAPFEFLAFEPVPEPKTVKNRIHWDVDVADVRLLVEHGATIVREPDDEISWTVLADPEGNEFCAFVD